MNYYYVDKFGFGFTHIGLNNLYNNLNIGYIIKMQQTQQVLLSVKHKLPQPNSILPSQLIKSQAAKHIRKRVYDVSAVSSYNWPLDQVSESKQQQIANILSNYYGSNFDITQLLKLQNKIVFLNSMVHPQEHQDEDYYFGSISTVLTIPRHSVCNPFMQQATYQLEFDDKLQSGNLYFALQHEPKVYLLANRLDYNTRSYGQWFYFKVKNVTPKSGTFRFFIINMTKNGAMFGKGLKISVCRKGIWSKEGTNIQYIQNKFIRKHCSQFKGNLFEQTYYTLSFSLQINAYETIYVAYNQPYTYTKLGAKLDELGSRSNKFNRTVICRTPLGNRVELLTIAKKDSDKIKKIIFITARAHPVETAGSFVVEGILQQLINPRNPQAIDDLLKNYIIKIVPMINPDGVIVGNSRCNIYGFDLNRQWKNPSKTVSPQILAIKKTILKYQGRIQMFIDLHGHSTKKSVFAYGCHDIRNPIASREFPYLLSKFSQKDFIFNDCRFSMVNEAKNNKKDGTARISLWKKLRIPNIFTIQNSYCCAKGSSMHYDSKSYANIGCDILNSVCSYFKMKTPPQENVSKRTKSECSSIIQKQSILCDLLNNERLIIETMKNQQQASSQSQAQDRIQLKQQNSKSLIKNIKNPKNYYKSKTQKIIKNVNIINTQTNEDLKQISATNNGIQLKNYQKQTQLLNSASNLQQKLKRRYLRNLSPLNKQLAPLKKCGGMEIRQQNGSNQKQVIKPTININMNRSQKKNILTGTNNYPNNLISVVQIGIQTYLNQKRDKVNAQMTKAHSTKNIKSSDYGIYHAVAPSNINTKTNKALVGIANNFLTIPDTQAFSDHHQFRQPILKIRKNLSRNSSKLNEFMKKLAGVQNKTNVFINFSKIDNITNNK